jgi:hypothetical protein
MVASGAGALAALEIVAAEEVEGVGYAEVSDFVGLAMFVDEQGEADFGFLLEDAGVVGIAQADGREGGTFFAEGLLVFAQLRDVLAAKDSAVVAKEDEDSGIVFPEGAETDLLAEGVGENDVGELLAKGYRHDAPSLKRERTSVKAASPRMVGQFPTSSSCDPRALLPSNP